MEAVILLSCALKEDGTLAGIAKERAVGSGGDKEVSGRQGH